MHALAKTVIQSAAFLALSEDVTVDGRVAGIEEIREILRTANQGEVEAIRAALQGLNATERAGSARADLLKFYEQFLQGFGLASDGVKHEPLA